MSYPATVFRVMIASPGDVQDERDLAREIVFNWNSIHSENKLMVLLPLGWEHDSYPLMGSPPQDFLNEKLVDKCDVLVGIFWTKIGTPTKEFPSGTVEEIERHIEAGKPVLLYFSEAKINPGKLDQEQYNKLGEFKDSCKDRGLYQPFISIDDFKDKFSRHLPMLVNDDDYFENEIKTNILEVSSLNFLDPEDDEELSEEAKILLIETSKDKQGRLMRYGSGGPNYAVQTNGKQLAPNGNPRTVAKWDAAVEQLESLDYIEDVGYKSEIFKIKEAGWDYLEKNGLVDN